MSGYQISFKSSAAKEFRKLSKSVKRRIQVSLNELQKNPFPSGVTKLKGSDSLFRIRVGDYRVVYTVNSVEKKICVTRVRHRRDVYRD